MLGISSPDDSESFALPPFTVNRWDITLEGNQELPWFNIAAQIGTLLHGKTIVRDSITTSVRGKYIQMKPTLGFTQGEGTNTTGNKQNKIEADLSV